METSNRIKCFNCQALVLKSSMAKHKKSKKCMQYTIFINPIDNCEDTLKYQSSIESTDTISIEDIEATTEQPKISNNNNIVLDLMLKRRLQKEKIKHMCMRIWDEVTIERENDKKNKARMIQDEYDNTDIEVMEALNDDSE
jgi:hypothetical protein